MDAPARPSIGEAWEELPLSWLEGLNISKLVASSVQIPEMNKYKIWELSFLNGLCWACAVGNFICPEKQKARTTPLPLPNETTFCLSVIKCLTHLFFLRLSIDNIEKIFELLLFCSWWFCTGVITSDGIIDSDVWLYKDFLDINCGKGWIRSRIFLKLSSMDLGNFLNCFSLSQVIHSDVPVYFVNAQILLSTDRCLRVLILTDS